MDNSKKPASPLYEIISMVNGVPTRFENHKGLTKREMFAMAAMHGLLVNMGRNEFNNVIGVSRGAVNAADALLAALESISDSHTNATSARVERGETELEKQLVFIDQYIEKHYAKFMDDQNLILEAIENAPKSLTVALNNILANLAQGITKGAQNQLQAVLADMVDWRLTAKAVEEWERIHD